MWLRGWNHCDIRTVSQSLFLLMTVHYNTNHSLAQPPFPSTTTTRPIFHYSQYLLKTMGHDALFMSAMLAYVVRAFGYTLLTPSSVHWVLLLEVLHGITFACMWIASIDFSAAAAPRDWATTFQSILSMTMSIGGGIGPMIGGHVMGRYGPVFMYRGAGWFITAVLFVHAAICLDCRRGYDAFLESLDTKRVEARDDSDSSTILVEEAAVDNAQRDMECHL
jgi:MFS family permease